jgi:hypothetical protein
MRTVHVHAYERRRPQKPDAYRSLHNRLYDEVLYLEAIRLELVDELASELEQAEEHGALAGRR